MAYLVLFVESDVCRCDSTLNADLMIMVTCLLLLIGHFQQPFFFGCPVYLTVSVKLSLLIIITFLVDAVRC